jgi:hypothetical protein
MIFLLVIAATVLLSLVTLGVLLPTAILADCGAVVLEAAREQLLFATLLLFFSQLLLTLGELSL